MYTPSYAAPPPPHSEESHFHSHSSSNLPPPVHTSHHANLNDELEELESLSLKQLSVDSPRHSTGSRIDLNDLENLETTKTHSESPHAAPPPPKLNFTDLDELELELSGRTPTKTLTKTPVNAPVYTPAKSSSNIPPKPVSSPVKASVSPAPVQSYSSPPSSVSGSLKYGNSELDSAIQQLEDWKMKLNQNPTRSNPREFDDVSREMSQCAKSFVKSIDQQPLSPGQFASEASEILSRVRDVTTVLYFWEEKNLQKGAKDMDTTGRRFADSSIEFLKKAASVKFKTNESSEVINSRNTCLKQLTGLITELQSCFKLTTPTCHRCGRDCEDNYMKVGKASFHKNCFKCDECSKPITMYHEVAGKFLCEDDYQRHLVKTGQAVTCSRCNGFIEGDFVKIDEKSYHNHCFTCSKCGTGIVGKFFEEGDKVFCGNCYDR